MTTHDLKPKNVERTLDIKFLLEKKEKKDHDKHKEKSEKSVSKSEQD